MLRFLDCRDFDKVVNSIIPAAYINKLRAPHAHWKPLCTFDICNNSVDCITRFDNRTFVECESCLAKVPYTLVALSKDRFPLEKGLKDLFNVTEYHPVNLNGLMNCYGCREFNTDIIPANKDKRGWDTSDTILWDTEFNKFVSFCVKCAEKIHTANIIRSDYSKTAFWYNKEDLKDVFCTC